MLREESDESTRTNGKLAIALDVDGTLVSRDGIVPDAIKQALQRRWDDATFILASGRPPGGIHYIFEQIERSGYYVALNGGVVAPGPGQSPFQVNALTYEQRGLLIDLIQSTDMIAGVFGYEADSWGAWGSPEWAKFEGDVLNTPASRHHDHLEEFLDRPVIQMSMTVDDPEHQRVLFQMAQDALPDTLLVNEPVPQFIEVIRRDSQKNNGLDVLAQKLGFEKLIAVGDSDNDLGMVKSADISYAMGHGAPVLQAAADIVIEDPAFDNLAELINRLFDQ